jgi:type IV pilus assembly protein PilF
LATLGSCSALLALSGCVPHVKKNADEAQIHFQLAGDYFRHRRVEAALDELQRALASDPNNADAYNLLGLISLQQGAEYSAQAEIDTCLKAADAQAVRRDQSAKFHDAEEKLRRATELRPTFSEAWNNLAVAALNLQEYDLAIVAAGNALKDVTYAEPEVARANLGWAYFLKNDLRSAWKELHEAVARSPGFCVGRYRLAKVYVARNEIDRAAEELEAVTGSSQCPIQEAFLLGGMVQERRKESSKARDLFARCGRLAPRSCLAAECKRYSQLIQ